MEQLHNVAEKYKEMKTKLNIISSKSKLSEKDALILSKKINENMPRKFKKM